MTYPLHWISEADKRLWWSDYASTHRRMAAWRLRTGQPWPYALDF
jgi:hypothetical protein